MKSITVYHYDAFSKEPDKGNPAGVVLNGAELSEAEMQEVAFKVAFNDAAFPSESDGSDVTIRFITPGHEKNLCGHATMGHVYKVKSKGVLGDKADLTIETNAVILPIKMNETVDGEILITMKQASP